MAVIMCISSLSSPSMFPSHFWEFPRGLSVLRSPGCIQVEVLQNGCLPCHPAANTETPKVLLQWAELSTPFPCHHQSGVQVEGRQWWWCRRTLFYKLFHMVGQDHQKIKRACKYSTGSIRTIPDVVWGKDQLIHHHQESLENLSTSEYSTKFLIFRNRRNFFPRKPN